MAHGTTRGAAATNTRGPLPLHHRPESYSSPPHPPRPLARALSVLQNTASTNRSANVCRTAQPCAGDPVACSRPPRCCTPPLPPSSLPFQAPYFMPSPSSYSHAHSQTSARCVAGVDSGGAHAESVLPHAFCSTFLCVCICGVVSQRGRVGATHADACANIGVTSRRRFIAPSHLRCSPLDFSRLHCLYPCV